MPLLRDQRDELRPGCKTKHEEPVSWEENQVWEAEAKEEGRVNCVKYCRQPRQTSEAGIVEIINGFNNSSFSGMIKI